MDAFYGAGCWTYRTSPGVGSDLGAALNAAIAAALPVYQRLDILIPPTGPWRMATPISPLNVTGHHIHGACGPWGTVIYYDNDASFLDITYNGGSREGGLIEDLVVSLEPNRPNAQCFLRLFASDNSGSPSGYVFNRLRCSADPSSSWIYTVAMSGVARTSPPGIRGVVIRDSVFFCGRQGGLWASGVNFAVFENLGFYVPSGPTGADITITGVDTPQTRSNNISFKGVYTLGKVSLTNTTYVAGDIGGGLLTVDTSVRNAGLFYAGVVSGAPASGFVTSI